MNEASKKFPVNGILAEVKMPHKNSAKKSLLLGEGVCMDHRKEDSVIDGHRGRRRVFAS